MYHLVSIPDLPLESGGVLARPVIAAHSWGQLNAQRDNVILVCHSLTSDSDASVWWPGLIGPGCALDTDRYFVICLNALGSPYGSTSPISAHPDTGERYGHSFPAVTIRDTVRAHRMVLSELGVRSVQLAVGGSMGGMQVLEWSFQDLPVRALAVLAVGGRHSPWGIAWTEAQRQAIYSDPAWNDGDYAPDRPPVRGLATARMMAMISYRTATEFQKRFGRNVVPGNTGSYQVASYLRHHGSRLTDRFDANCYVHLTLQMNTHDVSRGRGCYVDVLSSIEQPTLVVGFSSDILYPLHEQEELACHMPRARLAVIDSVTGHDGFLTESGRVAELLATTFFSPRTRRQAFRHPVS